METRTMRIMRLMSERMEAIDSMRNPDGSLGEGYHKQEVDAIKAARRGHWTPGALYLGSELIAIENDNIAAESTW